VPAGSRPVLAELDRLEAAWAAVTEDDEIRPELAKRLRGLLSRVMPDESPAGARLASASDDEIFNFIDNEFGTA